MYIVKHKELMEHIFTDILKTPMMSKYYPECEQTLWCDTQHLGKCRYLCYNCSGTRNILFHNPEHYDMIVSHNIDRFVVRGYIPPDAIYKVVRSAYIILILEKYPRWFTIESKPECDSCKYIKKWKKDNWRKYVERAVGGGPKERKELRRIFYKKDERLAIRKLLTLFNCNTTIPMRDSLSGVIDYMYPV